MPFSSNGLRIRALNLMVAVLCFMLGISYPCIGFSQSRADSLNDKIALDSLRAMYLARIGESSPFYNGVQYIRDGRAASGFPFYGTDSLQTGDVTLIGFTHPRIPLYYDLVADDLVAENFNRSGLFRVPRATVTSFRLGEDSFVHLQPETTHSALLRDGYYEFMSAGPMTLFIRWQKVLQTRPGYDNPEYKLYSYYYLQKGNDIFELVGKKSLLDLMKDQDAVVKKFINAEDLNFKKDPKSAYIKTIRYYAALKF